MLDNKYKEIKEELSGFNEDIETLKTELEREKNRQLLDLVGVKSEIKSGKKYSKLGGRNWWFRFKLYIWKLLMSFYY